MTVGDGGVSAARRVTVQATALSKTYGSLTAVRELSLEIPQGEILALVGPNGAGKTTALKLLVGLLTPTAGSVRIDGLEVIRDHLEVKRRLAFLPDQPFLYEQLTVAETLSFIGGLYELSPQHLRERSAELLSLFGLAAEVRRRVGQLSFGMKSRVALITSLLRSPKILIMDEPFFGLDPQTLRLIKQHLAQQAQAGMTVVLSTHQLPVVEDVAHRIAILDRGRLMALGTLEELTRSHGGHRLEEVFFQLTSHS